MSWRRCANLSDFAECEMRGVEIDGEYIAIFHIDGAFYATEGMCTHALAFLAEGFLEDGAIECPLHQGRFDVRSGQALGPPVTKALRTYSVKLVDDEIYVHLGRDSGDPPAPKE